MFKTFHIQKYLIFLALALGVVLRFKHYLENRSFWLDETWVGIALTSSSYLDIIRNIKIFPDFPYPPMLFMLIEKLLLNSFGNNEMVLRLFPFVCSLAAVFLFYKLMKKSITGYPLVLALFLFSISEPLVYYAAELKQYSTDLLIGIILLLLTENLLNRVWSKRDFLLFSLAGTLAIWISNMAVFILPVMGFVLLLQVKQQKEWKKGGWVLIACAPWLISFIILYKTSLGSTVNNAWLLKQWHGELVSENLFSLKTIGLLKRLWLNSFKNPCGLAWPFLGTIFFVFGFWRLLRQNLLRCLLFALPIALAFFAAILGKFPFTGRLILFLIPSFFLFIVVGLDVLAGYFNKHQKKAFVVLSIILLAYPMGQAYHYWVHGRDRAGNKPVLEFFNENYQQGDLVFLNTSADFAFLYYGVSLKFFNKFPKQILGVSHGTAQAFKIGKFARFIGDHSGIKFIVFKNQYHVLSDKGFYMSSLVSQTEESGIIPEVSYFNYPVTGRCWVFLSDSEDKYDGQINSMILTSFDRRAQRLLSYERKGAAIYLYNLTQ